MSPFPALKLTHEKQQKGFFPCMTHWIDIGKTVPLALRTTLMAAFAHAPSPGQLQSSPFALGYSDLPSQPSGFRQVSDPWVTCNRVLLQMEIHSRPLGTGRSHRFQARGLGG